MNPWAGLIIVVAILLIIIAWKGTQDNVLTALLNRPYQGNANTAANMGSGGSNATLAASTTPQLTPLPVISA